MEFTRSNEAMQRCLHQLASASDLQPLPVDMIRLSRYLLSPFQVWQACILLDANISDHMREKIKQQPPQLFQPTLACPHRSDLEAAENHIHITDFLTDHYALAHQSLALLYAGLGLADWLTLKLRQHFPQTPFRLIVNSKLAALDEDDDLPCDCIVRFHQLRPGETWHPDQSGEAKGEFDILPG
jgi:hypothetical protein